MLGMINACHPAHSTQPAQRGREYLDQQHRHPESGHRHAGQRQHHDRRIDPAMREQPGHHPQHDAEGQPEQEPATG